MRSVIPVLVALCSPLLLGNLALAGTADGVEEVRKEIEQLRRDYEQRLRALEDRLWQMEAQRPPAASPPVVSAPVPATNAPAPGSAAAAVAAMAQGTNLPPAQPSAQAARPYRFRNATESRQRAIALRQEEAFKERVEQVLESFVDITGYFRAGYGVNSRGGPQTAFQAPGAFSKYRLGNEAEIYGELGFGKDFYLPKLFSIDPTERPSNLSTGPVARVQLLLSAYNPYQDLLTASGTDFGLPEAWASIGNVVRGQPELKVWAGSRYYRRHDIHISDFFFYNMSGAGGGVEDIQLPFGKAAFAWIGSGASSGFSGIPQPDPENEAGFSKDNLDLRVYDVPVPLGKGEFGVVFARAGSGQDAAGREVSDSQGFSVNALHTREKFLSEDGFNKLSLQFGTGPAKTFTSGFETIRLDNGIFIRPDARDSWRFRFTEHFIANLSEHFSISPAVVYQLSDSGSQGGKVHWASAGVRPILHFNRYFSLAAEFGVDWVKDVEARTSDYLYKITIAPQVSLGNRFLSRPVIRVFATHAGWGDDFLGQVGGIDYERSQRGWTYGMQMEAWW
jgi:maltoporin